MMMPFEEYLATFNRLLYVYLSQYIVSGLNWRFSVRGGLDGLGDVPRFEIVTMHHEERAHSG